MRRHDEVMVELQQIGSGHPVIKLVRAAVRSHAPGDRFVAEGLWAHSALLELGGQVELFLWCPEEARETVANRVAEASRVAAEVAARAERSYRISPKVLERVTTREQPDGLVSLVRLPTWDGAQVASAGQALVLVADGIEIPGNLGTLLRTLDACGGRG